MTPDDINYEEDEELVDALGQSYEEAIGKALDLSASLKEELIKGEPDGLMGFIAHQRTEAIAAVNRFADPTFDPANSEAVRAVQMEVMLYSRAVAFAQKAITGYMDGGLTAEGDESLPVD